MYSYEGRKSMSDTSEIWTGEAAHYDQVRPSPPTVLVDILTQLIHNSQPTLVVDLGSGTGLSTMMWGERAQRVIGIEPNADMRSQAVRNAAKHPHAKHIAFQEGISHQTGLPDGSVDIVTCSQSFHWMEPTSTLAEVARILRLGGFFAVYDYSWPPALGWEVEQTYQEVDARFDALLRERELEQNLQRWPKEKHLERMRESGHFRFTRELLLHHIEYGNAERFMGMIMTNSYSHEFKLNTITEEEIGLARLREAAQRYIGSEALPWYFSYKVRIGIK
jgi:ubiquinone/menaquinone biosynthesis C-methylase UbiE